MTTNTNHLVFLCYGNDRVFHECTYALMSLSALYSNGMPGDTRIWIYTDRPGWFDAFRGCELPISYRKADSSTIKKWRGGIDFVHRVKIEVLKDLTANQGGNILYADTDVVFTGAIDPVLEGIESGNRYMHIMEGVVSECRNPIFKKLNDHLKAEGARLYDKPMQDMAMWNAGVLGFNSKDATLLDEVLAFTDKEYPKFPKHVVEQFAFSAYFSKPGDIKAAAPYILHYWNLKEAGIVLASFFKYFSGCTWNELVRYGKLLQIPALMQEKINFYQGRSLADKLLKKQWMPANPDWAERVKEL